MMRRRYWLTFVGLCAIGVAMLSMKGGAFHRAALAGSVAFHRLWSFPAWWWQRLRHLEIENRRLRTLLETQMEARSRGAVEYGALSVVQVRWTPRQVVMVARRVAEGALFRLHQGVVGPRGGAVGILMASSPPYYFVETIFSRHLQWIGAVRRFEAPLEWDGTAPYLRMPHIPASAGVQIGDTVFVHPRLGKFPPRTPIGTVVGMETDPGGSVVHLQVMPMEDITGVRTVFGLHTRDADRIDSLINAQQ